MTITEIAVNVRLNLCVEHSRYFSDEDSVSEEEALRCKIARINGWLWKRQQREWK